MKGTEKQWIVCGRFRYATFTALAIVLFGFSPTAQAYVRSKDSAGRDVKWRGGRVLIHLSADLPAADVPVNEVHRVVNEAVEDWNKTGAGCSDLRLELAAEPAPFGVSRDGHSVIAFRKHAWCREEGKKEDCHDPGMQALTTVRFEKEGQFVADHRFITEADIEINSVDFRWSTDRFRLERYIENQRDLRRTVTHELGHLLGLGHACCERGECSRDVHDHIGREVLPCSHEGAAASAIMTPTENQWAGMSSDEAQAICDLYPQVLPRWLVASALAPPVLLLLATLSRRLWRTRESSR